MPLEDGLTAEIDLYDGELEGLVTAEIEFPDEETALAYDRPGLARRGRHRRRAATTTSTLAVDGIPS